MKLISVWTIVGVGNMVVWASNLLSTASACAYI